YYVSKLLNLICNCTLKETKKKSPVVCTSYSCFYFSLILLFENSISRATMPGHLLLSLLLASVLATSEVFSHDLLYKPIRRPLFDDELPDTIPIFKKIPAIKRSQPLHLPTLMSSTSHSNRCSNEESKCSLSTGQEGCCPYKNGTCCVDKLTCCPFGHQCNIKDGTCIVKQDKEVNAVVCPDGDQDRRRSVPRRSEPVPRRIDVLQASVRSVWLLSIGEGHMLQGRSPLLPQRIQVRCVCWYLLQRRHCPRSHQDQDQDRRRSVPRRSEPVPRRIDVLQASVRSVWLLSIGEGHMLQGRSPLLPQRIQVRCVCWYLLQRRHCPRSHQDQDQDRRRSVPRRSEPVPRRIDVLQASVRSVWLLSIGEGHMLQGRSPLLPQRIQVRCVCWYLLQRRHCPRSHQDQDQDRRRSVPRRSEPVPRRIDVLQASVRSVWLLSIGEGHMLQGRSPLLPQRIQVRCVCWYLLQRRHCPRSHQDQDQDRRRSVPRRSEPVPRRIDVLQASVRSVWLLSIGEGHMLQGRSPLLPQRIQVRCVCWYLLQRRHCPRSHQDQDQDRRRSVPRRSEPVPRRIDVLQASVRSVWLLSIGEGHMLQGRSPLLPQRIQVRCVCWYLLQRRHCPRSHQDQDQDRRRSVPDGQSQCPDGSTCCKLQSGQYGCCPLEKATCCRDGVHCCPNGYKCDVSAGTCSKSGSIASRVKLSSCCTFFSGSVLCCKNGLVCDPKTYQCMAPVSEVDQVATTEPVHSADYPSQSVGSAHLSMFGAQRRLVACAAGLNCGSKSTCCITDSGSPKCCSHSDGVCCSGGSHCCPADSPAPPTASAPSAPACRSRETQLVTWLYSSSADSFLINSSGTTELGRNYNCFSDIA
ncbi:hypothetical protein BOX15_Mlig012272g1, partial [Macrostomum lignano]